MIKLKGKYGTATVYTNLIEGNATSQIVNMLNQTWAKDSHMRIMPDVHPGSGATIGTTFAITDKVVPFIVGTDIGCGVRTVNIGKIDVNKVTLEHFIKNEIKFGKEINNESVYDMTRELDQLKCKKHIKSDTSVITLSLQSVGGGNHFCEVNKSENGDIYITVHTGSRNFGSQLANAYQKLAYEDLTNKFSPQKIAIRKAIAEHKASGRESELNDALNKVKKTTRYLPDIPFELAYVEGELLDDYLHDIEIAQNFASKNRELILKKIIVEHLGFSEKEYKEMATIDSVHNYVDIKNKIVRKGAISAQKDELIVIPMNMRDGILICKGKGNPEWNYSAPHGCGRLYSRSQAKDVFDMDEYEESMKDVYSTSVVQSTLDECPMAYKPTEVIMEQIKDSVEIIDWAKAIINVKSSIIYGEDEQTKECE